VHPGDRTVPAPAAAPLAAWANFYVIVGSAGGALTGLQFVVMALISDTGIRSTSREVDAFGTPTIVHFCAVLLVSAILSAPWPTLASVGLALGACGLGGVAYGVIVVRRARQQTGYRPVLEDWLWHALFPLLAYAAVGIAAATLRIHVMTALFVVAAATLLLLFVGIHNSWDTVTFLALHALERKARRGPGEG
jgi:hypothetical protein